ncbi:MAG: sulfotransferase domain-containing protein [Myxococcota bacterium]
MRREFVSYPKSGRTWVRFMLNEIGTESDIHFHHDHFEFNNGGCPPHDFNLHGRLLRYRGVGRLVYLERDPRDVMVSLYHQVTGRFRDFFSYEGTLSEFLRHPYFGAANLRRFREMWGILSQQPNCLRITYEDCHADAASVLRRVLSHYEIPWDEHRLMRAVEHGRFDRMKRVEQSGEFAHPWLRPRNGSPKVRKGQVGGFAETLAQEDIAYLNSAFALEPSARLTGT